MSKQAKKEFDQALAEQRAPAIERSNELLFEAGMIASHASEYSCDERKRQVLLQLSGLAMEAIQQDLPNDVSNYILSKCGELQDEWFDED